MDIVHHTFIGGIGALAFAGQGQELAGLGFVIGSVFPDLDVALMAGGKRFYLRHHQGPTHSLPLAPLYAAVLAAPLALLMGWSWALFFGLLAGLAVHVLLDLLNTFGIQLLWPITRRRFCLDAVFFIDTVVWVLTAAFFALVMTGFVAVGVAALGYAALFLAYGFAKLALQRKVRRRLAVDFAIPSAWNPFSFFVFARRDGRLETATYNAWTGRKSHERAIPEASPQDLELARRSPAFRDMEAILRGLSVTEVIRSDVGTMVTAEDLAVRNFGGKFGRTKLHFDHSGRLGHEMVHI